MATAVDGHKATRKVAKNLVNEGKKMGKKSKKRAKSERKEMSNQKERCFRVQHKV